MFKNDCYPNHLWWVRLDEVGRAQAWLEFDLLKLRLPVFPHLLQYQTCHNIKKINGMLQEIKNTYTKKDD